MSRMGRIYRALDQVSMHFSVISSLDAHFLRLFLFLFSFPRGRGLVKSEFCSASVKEGEKINGCPTELATQSWEKCSVLAP